MLALWRPQHVENATGNDPRRGADRASPPLSQREDIPLPEEATQAVEARAHERTRWTVRSLRLSRLHCGARVSSPRPPRKGIPNQQYERVAGAALARGR